MLAGHYLAGLDTETTGLNEDTCEILEFGLRIVNVDGTYVSGCDLISTTVLPRQPIVVGVNAEQEALNIHAKTGLANRPFERSLAQVDALVAGYLNSLGFVEQGRQSRLKILGRNPAFDRSFMRTRMPKTASLFHYRLVDVDVCETLFATAMNTSTGAIRRAFEGDHTVANDIESTIAEYREMVKALRPLVEQSASAVPAQVATRPWMYMDDFYVNSTMTLAGPTSCKRLHIAEGAKLHTNSYQLVVEERPSDEVIARVVTP